jgi:hypothetical protein
MDLNLSVVLYFKVVSVVRGVTDEGTYIGLF